MSIQLFLAHASEDKAAVLELYERLKAQGYRPWVDKKNLIPGQNWREEIPKAIRNSQLFIVCVSPRFVSKQGYVQKEFRLALDAYAEKPPGSIYLIPLKLEDCEVPDLQREELGIRLRDLQWVDYFEADGFDRLVSAIEYQIGQLQGDESNSAPPPAARSLAPQSPLSPLPISTRRLQPVSSSHEIPQNIPRGVPEFKGRESDLESLHQKLQREKRSSIVAIFGMGGIGKTELALQYASKYYQNFYSGGVFWLRAREKSISHQIVNFIQPRKKLSLQQNIDFYTEEQLTRWCWENWQSCNQQSLVIFDDVTNYEEVKPYLPPNNPSFKVLITTRKRLGLPVEDFELDVLSTEPALELLKSLVRVKERIETDLEVSKEVCEMLGCLPLALELTGRYLEQVPHLTLPELKERLKMQSLFYNLSEVSDIINAAFELSWSELKTEAQKLAGLLSVFTNFYWDWEFIKRYRYVDLSEWEGIKLEDCISELLRLSWVQFDENTNTYRMHPLIKTFTRKRLSENLIDMLKNNIATYNVVLIGQTGVGKSSLINYLYGKDVAKIGTGKPVTQGFDEYNFHIGNMPVSLFDSWGLELGRHVEWMSKLELELNKRGVDKPPQEWFHSVFYCISAAGDRIQAYDKSVIQMLIESRYKVAIILTKVDLVNQRKEDEFKREIEKCLNNLSSPVPIISVCSEERTDRYDNKIMRFGKNEIEKSAYYNFWDAIKLRLPGRCISVVENHIEEERNNLISKINMRFLEIEQESPLKLEIIQVFWAEFQNKFSCLNEEIKNDVEFFFREIKEENGRIENIVDEEIRRTLQIFGQFAHNLNYSPQENSRVALTRGEVYDNMTDFNLKGTFRSFWSQAMDFERATRDINDFLDNLGRSFQELQVNLPIERKKEEIIDNLNRFIEKQKETYFESLEMNILNILETIFPDN